MSIWLANAGLLILAYLLGSTPTGYAIARYLKGIDIREVGSGSTGATNILRTLGKGPAIFVLMVDVCKGVLAVLLVRYAYSLLFFESITAWQPWMETLAGLTGVLGHSWSIWLGLKGGKSVATSLGVLLAMSWLVGLSTFGVFALTLGVSRIVSLSSIMGAIAVGGLMIGFHQPLPYILFGIAAGLYVIWRHRSNIQRLLAGTEPKIGQKLESVGEATPET